MRRGDQPMSMRRVAQAAAAWCLWNIPLLVFAQAPAQAPALPNPSPGPSTNPAFETSVVGVPYQRTVVLNFPEVTRVLSVDPAIIEATIISPGVVQLRALAFGQTFVHIWTQAGRLTRAVETTEPPVVQPTGGVPARRSADDIARDLTFEYQNRYRLQMRGPKLNETGQNTTTQFLHELSSQMDTPHGRASGRVAFQRINSLNELSTWNAALRDGDVGLLKRFDVQGGDVGVGYSDLTLPQGTVRGVDFDYYDLAPYKLNLFHGQRRLGFATGLSPSSQLNNDVFFSGGQLRYDAKPLELGFQYAAASGQDRVEMQTSQAMSMDGWYWLDDAWRVGAEAGRTQENVYGYRLKSAYHQGWMVLDAVYRNFSQLYENLLGQSTEQGERGILVTANEIPWNRLRLRQRVDWYDDTLFRNPEEPERKNLEAEISGDLDLTSSTIWSSSFGRQNLLGRLFPTDTTTIRTGLRQRIGAFPLLTNGNIFGDYQYRKLRSVSSPESDFHSHQLIFGLGAPLTDALSWQVTQDWILLQETLTGADSIPRETTAGLNYSQQLPWFPLFVHSGLNFSTTSSAESANSFLSNEDRWTWDGGARYSFSPDLEAFVETRLLRSHSTGGNQVEFEMETGVRYLLDTKIRWEPSLSLSGVVFEDANGDGIQGPGEGGIAHVTVQAGGAAPSVTDAGGRFYLGRVRGRMTEVSVDLGTLPEGYVATAPARREISLLKPPALPLLFGFVAQSELRVRVFVDAQGNGEYDATDVPLERVHVSLEDGTVRTTDRSGWAFFRGIKPGAYRVTMKVNDLAAGYVPATEVSLPAALSEGKAVLVDFPVLAERSVSGRVYVDRNRNANYDEEPLLTGTVLCLDGDRRATTREDGRYLFKGVSAGLHRISVNCGQPLPGLLPLNAAVQTVEISPQPVDKEGVDFRFGEKESIMHDVVSDVLRARSSQQQLIEEVIKDRKDSGR